jgi:dynactin complex subunit
LKELVNTSDPLILKLRFYLTKFILNKKRTNWLIIILASLNKSTTTSTTQSFMGLSSTASQTTRALRMERVTHNRNTLNFIFSGICNKRWDCIEVKKEQSWMEWLSSLFGWSVCVFYGTNYVDGIFSWLKSISIFYEINDDDGILQTLFPALPNKNVCLVLVSAEKFCLLFVLIPVPGKKFDIAPSLIHFPVIVFNLFASFYQ